MTINEIVALAAVLLSVGTNVALYVHLMNSRFDGMDRKFENVDRKFENVARNFESVDRRLEMITGNTMRLI